MSQHEVERMRLQVLAPLKVALERIDMHLARSDLRSAGMDMIAFVQLAEANSKELLALAERLSGTFPRVTPP